MIKNIMASECFNILKTEKSSRLIDVRTSHEWQNDGYADLEALGKKVHLISLTNEDYSPSTNFINQINNSITEIVKLKNFSYSFQLNSIYTKKGSLYLTDKENEIFKLLIDNLKSTFNKKQLLSKVWSRIKVDVL